MKDLDFDELDKAVNSLMSSSQSTPTQPSDDVATATPQGAVEEAPIEVAPSSPVDDGAVSDTATSKPKALATRRSGRFMDVVHPSSDMTSSLRSRPTREGLQLNPVTNLNDAIVDSGSGQAQQTEAHVDTESEWPDPIDVHTKATEQVSSETTSESSDDEELLLPAVASDDDSAAPATPFLPGAVVDKRPLGGGVPLESTSESDEVNSESSSASGGETEPDAQYPSEAVQAELENDIVAVESDATNVQPNAAKEVDDTSAQHDTEPITKPVVQSISQQYTPQPSSNNEDHTALYDGAAQALAHPAKKKSGWVALFIVLLLIALGAGSAAALYFLGYI